ncbi:hypothetical protein C8Q79DRAFT_680443 [Trametes meyenii]|nr:hypothetical protein C8Q79DRAFT_680443 [Trametes meyenii]
MFQRVGGAAAFTLGLPGTTHTPTLPAQTNAQRRMHAYGYYCPSSEVVLRAQPLPSWRSPRLSPTGPRTEHGRRTPQRFPQDPALVVPAQRGERPRSPRVLHPIHPVTQPGVDPSTLRGDASQPRRASSAAFRASAPHRGVRRPCSPPCPLALRPAKLTLRTGPHAAYGRAFPRPAPPRAFLGDAGWPFCLCRSVLFLAPLPHSDAAALVLVLILQLVLAPGH